MSLEKKQVKDKLLKTIKRVAKIPWALSSEERGRKSIKKILK